MKSILILVFPLFLGSGTYANSTQSFSYSEFSAPDAKVISMRALRDFQSRFSNVSEVSWFSDRNGLMSYFTQNGYKGRAYYNKNGRWQYSLVFFGEERLPKDVRASVKSVYFDFDITLVEEVQTLDGMKYIVYLQDQSNIKILKVSLDGESETMMDLVKK